MGSDSAKLEKKQQKAQLKLEKKRMKALSQEQTKEADEGYISTDESTKAEMGRRRPRQDEKDKSKIDEVENVPWYKDPGWVRAIIGMASLIVAIIALLITIFAL